MWPFWGGCGVGGLGAYTGGRKAIGSVSLSISQGRRDTGNPEHGGDRLKDTVTGSGTSRHRLSMWEVCWRPLDPSCQIRGGTCPGSPLIARTARTGTHLSDTRGDMCGDILWQASLTHECLHLKIQNGHHAWGGRRCC